MVLDIEAQITFLPFEAGGRRSAASDGYRAQFHYNGHDWDARHVYPDGGLAAPGATVRTWLSFLSPQQHRGALKPGMPFLIREGHHTIAYGIVTSVLS